MPGSSTDTYQQQATCASRATGEEGIVMSELGRQLQFPTRTFHKPHHLKDFTARLGLYACKEQRGKAVVVCLHAPQALLEEYRRLHPPAGAWLQRGWVNAVCDALDKGLPAETDPVTSAVPLITAMPAEQAAAAPQQEPNAAAAAAEEQSLQQSSQQVMHGQASHTFADCLTGRTSWGIARETRVVTQSVSRAPHVLSGCQIGTCGMRRHLVLVCLDLIATGTWHPVADFGQWWCFYSVLTSACTGIVLTASGPRSRTA